MPSLARRTFAALAHRNFRLFWSSQLVSLTGTWMHAVAQGWLVLQLTGSPFWLGAVGFAGTVPILLFSLFGGLAADLLPKRALLMATQGVSAALALALAALTALGWTQLWHVVLVALCLGTVNALDMPSRQSFVVEMVGRGDLHNAIALNSFSFNAARVAGPALAGATLAVSGVTACFALNALSYLPVVAALALMRGLPPPVPLRSASLRAHLGEGLAYLRRERRFQALIALTGAGSLLGFPCITLLPAFARDELGLGPRGFGFLMASTGAGALFAALLLAARGGRAVSPRFVGGAGLFFGAFLVAASLSRSFAVAAPLFALAGGGMVAQAAAANTLVQEMVPDALRGRIMSIFTLVLMGAMPLGNLGLGAVAHWAGTAGAVLAAGAILVVAVAAVALLRREVFAR